MGTQEGTEASGFGKEPKLGVGGGCPLRRTSSEEVGAPVTGHGMPSVPGHTREQNSTLHFQKMMKE